MVRATRLSTLAVACGLLVAAATTGSGGAVSIPARPLATGVVDPFAFTAATAPLAFAHARAAGTTYVRIGLDWSGVVGNGKRPPRGIDATDPSDRHYQWAGFDRQIDLAVEDGLEPIVTVGGFPQWALIKYPGKLLRPDPVRFARFVTAAARRYSGKFKDLPRVRYWQIWNEPNHVGRVSLKQGAADWYRELVNDAADAVHGVDSTNVVIAGNTSPFTTSTAVGPLFFMRQLLCMRNGATAPPTCDKKIHFDVWAHHPYTSGGPTHHATDHDSVSLGDLPEMKRLLDAAVRHGIVVSHDPIRFWVTEFSWDTDPPDPSAVPIKLQTRWVAEALYRMWQSGVSLVVWWLLRDQPVKKSFYQSGLYAMGSSIKSDRPKSTFYAFKFPFVAFPQGSGGISVWGRTPWGKAGKVIVEQQVGSEWVRRGAFDANQFGIFAGDVSSAADGPLRAELEDGSATSYPFSLQSPPDHAYYPFGS